VRVALVLHQFNYLGCILGGGDTEDLHFAFLVAD
jgi:hypothetical protein